MKLLHKSPMIRNLYVEAFFSLVWHWTLIRFVPYQIWKRFLGMKVQSEDLWIDGDVDEIVIQQVGQVFAGLRSAFGLRFTCLMLALSARKLLSRRGVNATLVLAVKPKERASLTHGMEAHAWVIVRDIVIVGGEYMTGFIPIGYYRLTCGLQGADL